jgi:rhodanese-related sulfurtransferase
VTPSADDLVDRARDRIDRIGPEDLDAVLAGGGLVVDIRPAEQRGREGELPGAVVVERNVLEWRLAPTGAHRLDGVTGPHQQIVIVCSEGYASSLAAAAVLDLGHQRVADLAGGYAAWVRWRAAHGPGR